MLLTGFSIISVPSSGSGPPTAADTDSQASTFTRLSPDWQGINWNWTVYEDNSGFVNAIIADINETTGAADIARVKAELGQSVRGEFSLAFHGLSVRLQTQQLKELLSSDRSLEAYPDLPVNATSTESAIQIGADQVWTHTDPSGNPVKGQGIVVAIIDTGVDYMHPDLGSGFGPGHKVIGGYDFYNNDSDPMDDNGHGTHVAGIIAADGGIMGVAPKASILAYKALGPDGSGSMGLVMRSIEAAMDPNKDGNTNDHADVISMSLGGAGQANDPVCLDVEKAIQAGVVVVVAAGNSGPAMGTIASPGVAPDAITVGAVNSNNALASFSSRGPTKDLSIKPEVSAPGVGITSTVPYSGAAHSSTTGYMAMSGTSMATPHVSGAAALLLQEHPGWTPAEVKSALVLGARPMAESVWSAGAGSLWVPSASSMNIFLSKPLISYGLASNPPSESVLTNFFSSSVSLSIVSSDYLAMAADGSATNHAWSNLTSVNPPSVLVARYGTCTVTLSVGNLPGAPPEGYFDGHIRITDASHDLEVPFGFAILSTLKVHVRDASGSEIYDPYGTSWICSEPDARLVMEAGSDLGPSPPATFLVPSGDYSVHAGGHQFPYHYSDLYLLSSTLSLGVMETREVYLDMSSARAMHLNLSTEDGQPIYVKDFRMYMRHVGSRNVSFDVTGSDYDIRGAALFTLPKSRTVYVSDTTMTVGISFAGFSYTPDMWDFMNRNIQHWYEWTGSTSQSFYIEATADLQYLLAWEFSRVDASTSLELGIDPSKASTYVTKYDIQGLITNPWMNWGEYRAMGADASFFVRRNADTSVNNFFSGMTRTTIVQGVWSELYFPENILQGFVERSYYVADYSHLVNADVYGDLFLPDRAYLASVDGISSSQRLGAGPFYPSLRVVTQSDSFLMFYPLLSDSNGARVGGMTQPSMTLYRDGGLQGIYLLAEYQARPDAERRVSLFGSGSYVVSIDYQPFPEMYDHVWLDFGFSLPSTDASPPRMTSMSLPQRFVPGQSIPLTFSAADDASAVTASVSWRTDGASSWNAIPVTDMGAGGFSSTIQTTAGVSSLDMKIRLTDSSGNYFEYTADKVAFSQTPVVFTMSAQNADVDYRSGSFTVVLQGSLTDSSANPLHSSAGIPLELYAGGRKVAMILDDYVLDGSHTHDGTIRFPWVFDPTRLFTGPNQTLPVTVAFDLGTYAPVTRTFNLHSRYFSNQPPTVSCSPGSGSLIAQGDSVTVTVSDDGASATASYSLDGGTWTPLPLSVVSAGSWRAVLSSASWADGVHTLNIRALDEYEAQRDASFALTVDALSPQIVFENISNGSRVPQNWTFDARVTDSRLRSVRYWFDTGIKHYTNTTQSEIVLDFNTNVLSVGAHTLTIVARDAVGHALTTVLSLVVADSSVTVSLLSPLPSSDGQAVIRSGVPIDLEVLGFGTITCTWSESGVSHILQSPYIIPTFGWSEGAHLIVVNAANQFGNSDRLDVRLTIDNSAPALSISPANGTVVSSRDSLSFGAFDSNLASFTCSIWGITLPSTGSWINISLQGNRDDGPVDAVLSAVDRAGNRVDRALSFILDCTPPTISITGASDGGSIAPGVAVAITGYDSTLQYVEWSLDGSATITTHSSSTIFTQDIGSGWHYIHAYAIDAAGNDWTKDVRFYVDSKAPLIIASFPSTVGANTTLELSGNISDDFAVGSASLEYELRGGSFQSIPLTLNGIYYATSIPSDSVWDGMSVAVKAVDLVGNSAESAHAIIHVVSGYVPPSPDTIPREENRSDNDTAMSGSWVSIWGGILFEGALLLGILALPFIAVYKRGARKDESDDREEEQITDIEPSLITTFPKAQLDIPAASPAPAIPRATMAALASLGEIAAQPAAEEVEEPTLEELIQTLDELIPSIPQRPQAPPKVPEPDIDYGEIIERELNLSMLRRSVFGPDDEFDKLFPKKEDTPVNTPERLSGLKIKKLLAKTELDDL